MRKRRHTERMTGTGVQTLSPLHHHAAGIHRYDITGAPATNGTNTNAATTTAAPQAQQMSHNQGATAAGMGAGGAPAPAEVAHNTNNTGAGDTLLCFPRFRLLVLAQGGKRQHCMG